MTVLTGGARPDPPLPYFSIELIPDRTHVLLVLRGELDLATVDAVEREATDLYDRGFEALVVDLRGLTFMDSTGLRLLVELRGAAAERGLRFAIVEGAGPAYRLLELSGVRKLISIVPAANAGSQLPPLRTVQAT